MLFHHLLQTVETAAFYLVFIKFAFVFAISISAEPKNSIFDDLYQTLIEILCIFLVLVCIVTSLPLGIKSKRKCISAGFLFVFVFVHIG